MIFDTHCHLGFAAADAGADAGAGGGSSSAGDAATRGRATTIADHAADVHRRAVDAGVVLLLDVGIDLASSLAARARAAVLPGVAFSAGLHPNDSGRLDAQWAELEALCRGADCSAVGETGLDSYRDTATPAQQEEAFERHLALAKELDKPVVIHCREAFARVYAVVARHPGVRGVMHCFTGGVAEARAALDLGLHLSFAGPLTYPRSDALRAAAAFAPADRLLVETDAPFLPPQGRRGQRNEPAWVVVTLAKLAELRGVGVDEMGAVTTRNGCRLFRLTVPPEQPPNAAPSR